MSGVRTAEILRQLAPPEAAGSDGELLRRFAALRDHAAFAELVRRHGPLVLTVCRRVAGHSQDAEDAFQAAFLVLARKAAALSQPERLGNWLYGVAVRVAQRARRSASRRRAREVQVSAMPDPPSIDLEPAPDIGPVMHEELSQLPGWYREAVILCDLRGVSRSDAAKILGIPEGTLSSRLANGRKKLAERLARRGIALPAAAVPAMLGEGIAFAAVPDSLIKKTCGLVADWAVGGAVPAPVHTLAAGGFTMRKMLLFGLAAAALAATGIAVIARPEQSASPMDNPKAIGVADAMPNANEAPIENADDKPVALGSPRIRKAFDIPVGRVDDFAWSPDGKGLVIRDSRKVMRRTPGVDPIPQNVLLYIPDITEEPQKYYWLTLTPNATLVGFTPDGKSIITAIREYSLISGFHKLQLWGSPPVKPAPDERGEMVLQRTIDLEPDQTYGYTFIADGKSFRNVYRENKSPSVYSLLEVREVDMQTGKSTKLAAKVEGEFMAYALSKDGKMFVTLDRNDVVVAVNVESGKQVWTCEVKAAVVIPPGGGAGDWRATILMSPDGKRVFVTNRRIGQMNILSALNGEAIPQPENVGLIIVQQPSIQFSGDGKLLMMSGERVFQRQPAKGGEPGFQGGGPTFGGGLYSGGHFLTVWDTASGKSIKSWDKDVKCGFLPNAPVLAVFESNAAGGTRLGLWDFAAEAPTKK